MYLFEYIRFDSLTGEITDNAAAEGAGLYLDGVNGTIRNSNFENNQCLMSGSGGAISMASGQLIIAQSRVSFLLI